MRYIATVLLFTICTTASADDVPKLKSGPTIGTMPRVFYVKDCTGKFTNEIKTCYRCNYGIRPVVSVFGKTLDPNTVKLLQALDKTIEAHAKVEKNAAKQMAGMFVLMTDNPDAGEAKIKRLQRKLKLKHLPLTVFDGTNGPAGYHINKDAAVTVSMWQKSEVKLNQSFRQTKDIKDETVTSVLKATKKILPPGQVKKDA
jgi:hypothetical protein